MKPWFRLALLFAVVALPLLASAAGYQGRGGGGGRLEDITRPGEDILDWVTGPLAWIVAGLGLAGGFISAVFFDGVHKQKLFGAFFGGIGMFMIGKILSIMSSLAG